MRYGLFIRILRSHVPRPLYLTAFSLCILALYFVFGCTVVRRSSNNKCFSSVIYKQTKLQLQIDFDLYI